jgi:uncharacterized protein YprB with RNaseH-like and TPR domain
MDLRDRLERIYGPLLEKSDLRRRLERLPQTSEALSIAEHLSGRWRENRWGKLVVIESDYPDFHRHGRFALEDVYQVRGERAALLAGDCALREFDPEQALFFDLETTGLAGGAGTCAFLIGAGYFVRERFCVCQFFLPDFESEHAFLREFSELVEGLRDNPSFRFLVSFNGKSFDANLLESRYVLQRLETPLSSLVHLDLLHPSRLLWKGRFTDCSLQTLEREVIGVERSRDIPSALIPETYFNYLHWGEFGLLREVVSHNRTDVVSMVVLLAAASRLVQEPDERFSVSSFRAARFHASRKGYARAATLLENALERGGEAGCETDALLQLARLRKRLGDFDSALELFNRLGRSTDFPPVEAFEEAGKILEHRRKDYRVALEIVSQGLEIHRGAAALERRRQRLTRRLAKEARAREKRRCSEGEP